MTRSLDADFFSRSPKTLAVAFAARAFVVSALGIGAERARGNLDELWALSILLVNLYSPFLPPDAKRRVEERFARLGMGSTFSAMSPPSDTRLMTLLRATWEAKDTAELCAWAESLPVTSRLLVGLLSFGSRWEWCSRGT